MNPSELQELIDWLIGGERVSGTSPRLMAEICERLVLSGLPLWRAGIFVRTLHPDVYGRNFVWRPGAEVEVGSVDFKITESADFHASPLVIVFQQGQEVRARVDDAQSSRFPIVEDLRADGVTDYLALPLFFTDGSINASKQSLDLLLQDFADHPAWAGCYLSVELWTPGSAGQLGQLPRYASEVSQYVKQKGAFAVSISPFISDSATDDGVATRIAFSALLAVGSIDIAALQDGVGARGLATTQLSANLPYYRAMLDACQNHCEVWANVESFASNSMNAATWERFLAQMQTLAPLVPNQITYEYTHYLMPSGPGGATATALNTAYRAWL
jgi:hypothetical protein